MLRRIFFSLLFSCMYGVVSAQTPNFALNDTSTYDARPIGINIGAPTYYDTYLLKNLVIANPGMQQPEVRQIKTVGSGTTTTFTTTNDWDGQPANYSAGWTFLVACNGGQGAGPGTCAGSTILSTGTIASNTANNTSTGETTYTLSSALSSALAANDSIWLFSPAGWTTSSGDFQPSTGWGNFGWTPTSSGSGSASIDTTAADLPPTLNGFATASQCVKLSITGSGDTAGFFTYFDTSGAYNYNFNGSFHQGIKAKVLSGSGLTLTMSVTRSSSGLNMSNSTSLSGGWNDYSVALTGTEGTTGSASNAQINYVLSGTSAGSVCLVGATLTNDADNNSTAYRNQTVSNMNFLKPGVMRLNTEGQAGTSLLNWITPQAYRRPSGVSGTYSGTAVTATQQGLHEFLALNASLGTQSVSIVVPPTYYPELSDLADYLAGGSGTTYGQYRISLGQTLPWASVFQSIKLEIGNETWNSALEGGRAGYPLYSSYWNYVTPGIYACQLLKTSGSWFFGAEKCVLSTWTAVPYTASLIASADTYHNVDMLAANQYMQNAPTSCTSSALWSSALVEPYANTQNGAASGFYDTNQTSIPIYVYEYQNGSTSGSCSQAQLTNFPEAQGYGVADVLAALWANKTYGITDNTVWQYLQPSTNISTSGGATSIKLWGIFTGSGGALNNPRPSAYALALANACIDAGNTIGTGDTAFQVTPSNVASFNFTSSNGVNSVSSVPYLQAFGFKNESAHCLLVANIDQSNSYNYTISGTNAPSGNVTQTLYSSTNITDNNEGANVSPTVTNVTSTVSSSSLSIPPHSLVSITW
jgi:hypothetical protein